MNLGPIAKAEASIGECVEWLKENVGPQTSAGIFYANGEGWKAVMNFLDPDDPSREATIPWTVCIASKHLRLQAILLFGDIAKIKSM